MKLLCKDNISVDIPWSLLSQSITISNMVDSLAMELTTLDEIEIPVSIIHSSVIYLILEYLQQKNNKKDVEYIFHRAERTTLLLELILAANFLEIQPLLDELCIYITSKIQFCTTDEIDFYLSRQGQVPPSISF